MAVHAFGNSVDLNQKLLKILKAKNIKLIEDAAEKSWIVLFSKNKKNTHRPYWRFRMYII